MRQRQLRSIVLDDKVKEITTTDAFRSHTHQETEDGYTTETRWREGNTICRKITQFSTKNAPYGIKEFTSTVTHKQPCFVEWSELTEACEIKPDNDQGPPWDEQDGWEHDIESYSDWREWQNLDCTDMTARTFGCCRGYMVSAGHRLRVNIDNTPEAHSNKAAIFRNMQKRGAAKQVAAEMAALWQRQYIDQLVTWRLNGCEHWWVACSYTIAGVTYEASLGGIDDFDYADTDVRRELADDVAEQLEQHGYIIVKRPSTVVQARNYKKTQQQEQNWVD